RERAQIRRGRLPAWARRARPGARQRRSPARLYRQLCAAAPAGRGALSAPLARARDRGAVCLCAVGDRRSRRPVDPRPSGVTRIFGERKAPPVFRSPTSLQPETATRPAASPPPEKARLAIVATSSTLCGVAAYAAVLRRQLDDAFDITLFDLDQYLLRSPHR